MIAAYDPLADKLTKPSKPMVIAPVAYGDIAVTEYLSYDDIVGRNVSCHITLLSFLRSYVHVSIPWYDILGISRACWHFSVSSVNYSLCIGFDAEQ